MAGTERLEDVLAGRPERTASRLICPRRLDPNTSYLACVVPAFEAGRRAGLGLPPEAADDASLRPAWRSPGRTPPVEAAGLLLVAVRDRRGRRLRVARAGAPRTPDPARGRPPRRVTSAPPGAPLPALPPEAPGAVVALRGALVPPEQPAPPWPPATRAAGAGRAAAGPRHCRRSGSGPAARPPEGPAVAPPLYGRWLAAQPTVPNDRRSALDADAEPRSAPSRGGRPGDAGRPDTSRSA